MSRIVSLVDQIVTDLNAQTFSQPFTAERKFVWHPDLSEVQDLAVSVLPKQIEQHREARKFDGYMYGVDVVITKSVQGDEDAEIDSMLTLTEEVNTYLRSNEVVTVSTVDYHWTSTINDPIYMQETIKDHQLYTALITTMYRAYITV